MPGLHLQMVGQAMNEFPGCLCDVAVESDRQTLCRKHTVAKIHERPRGELQTLGRRWPQKRRRIYTDWPSNAAFYCMPHIFHHVAPFIPYAGKVSLELPENQERSHPTTTSD